MKPPILLSATDAEEAVMQFNELLHEASRTITLLLVLGDDAIAGKGKDFVDFLLTSAEEDYESVAFIFVPNTSFILKRLHELTIKIDDEDFNWENFDDYTVLSISPGNNLISAFVTKEALDQEPAEIQIAILMAFSNGGLNNP